MAQMRIVDTNLLVYAFNTKSAQHAAAKAWLEERFQSEERLGLPWESLLGFARLVTNPRAFLMSESIPGAWRQVDHWLGQPNVWIPQPTERHQSVLRELLSQPGLGHRHIHDAHLAALAIEHGLILCSTDMDFGRFPHLRWENPLIPTHRAREPRVAYRTRKPRARK
ncbi:MAG TPA: PIN domain-containing protein [Kiritimatiellia bacterium]|nr:PIN domain-containing protein [Kiritimatiellia bacterium]